MQQFSVPQFLQREPKIAGPFTFKQFLAVVAIGGTIMFGYFILWEKSPFLFLMFAIFVGGGGAFLIFGKIQGMGTIEFFGKLLGFSFGSKKYLWRKKEFSQIEYLKKDSLFEEGLKAEKGDAISKIKKRKNIF
jgi:hypothetical protein